MTEQELELNLLLWESGELSPDDQAQLEAYLLQHPEAQALREQMQVLQDAGRLASAETVPETPELTLEQLRTSQPTRSRLLPRLLAIAAGFVLALAIWPHLQNNTVPHGDDSLIADLPTPSLPTEWEAEDPILDSLDALDQELDAWLAADLSAEVLHDSVIGLSEEDLDDLALELLDLEEAI